jgi:HEPN domain-containing protein
LAKIYPNESLRFSRVATQRYDDARFLLGHRNQAAIYLAGYAVECILKALLLSRIPARKTASTLRTFRGEKGHDLEWLKVQYYKSGGDAFPPRIAQAFARVRAWSTDLRYDPGTAQLKDATPFLEAVEQIIVWARGRL